MKIIFFIASLFAFTMLCGGISHAFRCGDSLVSEGDTKAKVLLECGSPMYKEKIASRKSKQHGKSDNQRHSPHPKSSPREVTKPVEKWYYNCGSNDFIYVLTFEGGILKSEATAGYGKGESQCKGR